MNPLRIAGLAAVLFGAAVLAGCSEPVRSDGHMFEHWADTVAAIPIDNGGRPAAEATRSPTAPVLKIDLVDHLDATRVQDLGLKAAASFVESNLTGLRRKISIGGPEPEAGGAAAETAGGWVAQLAAFPTRDAAEGAWAKLKASHPDVLGGLSARFESVDLGGRGVWTRVQAGPFPSRSEAAAVCAGAGVADRWCVAPRRD
jgi:hypothetical protein